MKRYISLSLLFITFTTFSFAQDCKVKLESINTEYQGDCKKGLAHGKGKALGNKDVYEGHFKKGYPHGIGTYTWGNGNTYEGNFKNGLKDGKGKLTLKYASKEDGIQEGYFKKGNYIGKYEKPYKLISKQGVRRVTFNENAASSTGNLLQVKILVYSNGSLIQPNIEIQDLNNTRVESVNGSKVLINPVYPLKKVRVSFTLNNVFYNTSFDLYKKCNWDVEISI